MAINIQISQTDDSTSGARKHLTKVDRENPNFADLWNGFLAQYPIHTYRHALSVLEHRKLLMGDALKDCSFVLKGNNEQPLAICPLLIVEDQNGKKISAFGSDRFAPIPLTYSNFSEKQRRAIEDVLFEEAISLLARENADRWLVEADILSVGTELIEDQVFARCGALDVSIHQHIVDLSVGEDAIRRQLRRRARTEINNGLRAYEFHVFDQENYTDEVGERHRLLHHKTAGRVTRPIITFHRMYEWVKQGNAFFLEQRHEGQTVNMTLVELGKRTACGASTADDPDFNPEVPLMHSMMWMICLECKKRGIDYLEIGETNFRDTMHQMLTPKERNIIYFKRGFGESSWPLKRWIWFRDQQNELAYLKEQLERYEKHISDEIL